MSLGHSPSIVTSGLVLYLDAANSKSYPGVGTVWADLSGNGNNGTLVNSPTYSSTNSGLLTFNGTNNYISTNYTQTSVTQYTIDFWFKTSSTAIQSTIVQNRGSGSGKSITMGLGPGGGSSGRIFIGVDSDGLLIQIATTVSYADNNWHNAVGTFNQASGNITTNSFLIYVDGVLASMTSGVTQAGTTATSVTGLGGTNIGYHQAWNTYFTGSLGYVKIYNTALTATQVFQNFNATRGRYGI